MNANDSRIPTAILTSLDLWHDMVRMKDMSPLRTILHPDAVFRSPMAYSPYSSAAAVDLILKTVITEVFEDFEYFRSFFGDDRLSVVLEFGARVGDKLLKGIDMIRFDDAGLIVEFEVMLRPLSGLQALGSEMGRRIGDQLMAFKPQK
jgi:hypothetical protein